VGLGGKQKTTNFVGVQLHGHINSATIIQLQNMNLATNTVGMMLNSHTSEEHLRRSAVIVKLDSENVAAISFLH